MVNYITFQILWRLAGKKTGSPLGFLLYTYQFSLSSPSFSLSPSLSPLFHCFPSTVWHTGRPLGLRNTPSIYLPTSDMWSCFPNPVQLTRQQQWSAVSRRRPEEVQLCFVLVFDRLVRGRLRTAISYGCAWLVSELLKWCWHQKHYYVLLYNSIMYCIQHLFDHLLELSVCRTSSWYTSCPFCVSGQSQKDINI